MPVDLMQYNSAGVNLICGQTYGHEQGPEKYKAYVITFDGRKLLVSD